MAQFPVSIELDTTDQSLLRIERHSFVNLINVVHAELQLIERMAEAPGSLRSAIHLAEAASRAFKESRVARRHLEEFARFAELIESDVEESMRSAGELAHDEGVVEARSILSGVLEDAHLRVQEVVARHRIARPTRTFTRDELAAAATDIVVESERELKELDEVAAQAGTQVSVLLRINPSEIPKGFGVSMARRPTIFGIDEEVVDDVVRVALGLRHVVLRGFHVYAGTQCLDASAVAENIRNVAGIFRRLIEGHDLEVEHLVFGSGFGIRYHAGAEELEPTEVASGCIAELDALKACPGASSATMALEMGRYLVGEAGWFLARVLATKHTRGADLLALDGGMNHYLGASGNLGGVLKRNYPVTAVTGDPERIGTYDLCGPLCTNIDALGKRIETRALDTGDVIAIGCAGAYGLTSSPIHFISHAPPREVLLPSAAASDAAIDITAEGPAINPPDWSRFAD